MSVEGLGTYQYFVDFFQSIVGIRDKDLLDKCGRVSSYKKLKEKEYLIMAGQREEYISFLVSGVCRGILVSKSSKKEITDCIVCKPGTAVLAESGLNPECIATIHMQCLTDCEFILVSKKAVIALKNYPEVMNIYMRQFTVASDAHVQISRARCLRVEERIEWFWETYPELTALVEDQYIASYLNMDKATYCRKAKQLRKKQTAQN